MSDFETIELIIDNGINTIDVYYEGEPILVEVGINVADYGIVNPESPIISGTAKVSLDAGNIALLGSDGGLYVPPDEELDFSAYYILAKS